MVKDFTKNIPKSIKQALDDAPLVVGIGPSAWPRIISAYYFPKFKILCHSDCDDNDLINKEACEVFSIKKTDPFSEVYPVTPSRIVENEIAQQFLSIIKEPFSFLIYKSYPAFETICEEKGWHFIGNTIAIKNKYEDKRIFKEILREIGIEAIPGENIKIEELTPKKFEEYQKTLKSKKLVLQLAEATWGGGSGTMFMDNSSDISKFHERVKELRKNLEGKKKELLTVNIAPFIEGISASIPCCTTKFGVLTGSIQTQIIDVPEIGAQLPNRSGVFAGHDWSFKKYSKESNDQASWIGKRFGDYLYKNGYKGIFGLDLIVEESGKVWPVECNPRETDAFPLVCMLQMQEGAIPMQIFHNLEHLNSNYEIDFEEVDESYKKHYAAAQILIYNKTADNLIDRKTLKAGIYKVKNGELVFVRSGFAVWHLKAEDEFLLIEDIAKEPGNIYSPHERMLRLIRKAGMLDKNGNLKKEVVEIADKIYDALDMIPVEMGLLKRHDLSILVTGKLKAALSSSSFSEADIINTLRNTQGGIHHPANIAWRKKIVGDIEILKQVKSKRARKQIATDLRKIASLGIEVKILDDIDEKIYKNWFELYKKIISAKDKGHVVVDDNWLAEKKKKGKKVGAILAYKDGTLIGGELFFEMNKALGIGYGISEKVDNLAGGLGLLMDYKFLEYAQKLGYQEVSFGQDTNIYGHDLMCGLILYKAKLGFTPNLTKKGYWLTSYFKNFAKFENEVMFFAGDRNKITSLVVITSDKSKDYSAYLPQGIEKLEVFDKNEILKEHSQYLRTE